MEKENQVLLLGPLGFQRYILTCHVSNLFLMKVMFRCPIKSLFTLFARTFFKISKGLSLQLVSKNLEIAFFEDSVGFTSSWKLLLG